MKLFYKFYQMVSKVIFFLTIFYKVTAQENFDQINYLEDSLYTAIKEIIESDTSQCSRIGAMIALNRAAEIYEIKRKDDTLFKYTKHALNKYPHEISDHFFWMDSFFTIHVKNSYSKYYPKTYKYMLYFKDSIEKTYNKPLQEKIIHIFNSTQRDKNKLENLLVTKTMSEKTLKKVVENIKLNNLKRFYQLDSIIKIHGYPGKSLVGTKYSSHAILLIQQDQTEKQYQYLDILTKATKNKELNKGAFASYIDQLLIGMGRKQVFGNHYRIHKGEILTYPIGNPEDLDKRRRNYGLLKFNDYLKGLQKRENELNHISN
ncbi:MAG: hypothetical protein IPH93_09105 [Saprospiraceae bacterium]|nr:hypothetical protein [Saprospiraceae bacterium]